MRATTSPLRTVAPSSVSVQVTTPLRSAVGVARPEHAPRFLVRPSRASPARATRPSSSAFVAACALRREASMRCSSMPAWRSATSDCRSSSAEVSPSSKSCLLRSCSSLRGLQLQLLDLELGVELGERVLEGELRARLLVGLERQVLVERLDRQDRGVDVQLDDRFAGLHRGAGLLEHAHQAGVDRARQDLLDLRHDGARGREGRVDRALVDDGRADR